MKICIAILLINILFVNTLFAGVYPLPSVGISVHPVDDSGNWGSEKLEYKVGEKIGFQNPYRIPVVQEDAWEVKDLQTGELLSCDAAYNFQTCKMKYYGEGCDSANNNEQFRTFDKPGTYELKVLGTSPYICYYVVTKKNITILPDDSIVPTDPSLDNFAWLIPITTLILN